MKISSLNNVPQRGSPIGIANLYPAGDRGPTFGQSRKAGIQTLGKVAGFWTAPYDGIITAVYLSVDQGGATIQFRRRRGSRGGVPGSEDLINRNGYTIRAPAGSGAHQTFTNLTDFLDVNVLKGDIFTTEIIELFDPNPTDVGGNILVEQTDGSIPLGAEQLKWS